MMGGTIRGQSNDTKPTTVPQGTKFEELDTGKIYLYDGSNWKYWMDTEERKIFIQQQNNGEGSPFIRLTGDEFATTAESALYLLEDLTSAIGGGALTNNNGVTFPTEADLPLRGFYVGNFASASSQYLSRATEAQFEVGTGSFIASIWFKTSTTGAAMTLWSYGDLGVLPYITVQINSSNQLFCQVHDGTVSSSITDIANRWQDGSWHNAIIMLDTSLATDTLFMFCDGQLIGSAANALGTLNATGKSFAIGARQNTSFGQFWNGQLANFHLIKAADYKAIAVLNQGIRESVISGTIPTPTTDTAKRLNNKIVLPATANAYTTCVIDLEDGEYEIQVVYERQAAGGTLSLELDGVQVVNLSTDGSAGSNIISKTYGVKIGSGQHILKVKNTEANTIPVQWITFVKRKGHENGGATEFLLLGDELAQRVKNPMTYVIQNSSAFNSYFYQASSPADGDYVEGEIFLKGGLWRFYYLYAKSADYGKTDLDFGSAEVLDQLDTYAGSTLLNQFTTMTEVRLNQGKTNIKAIINGKNASSGGYYLNPTALRGVRISD